MPAADPEMAKLHDELAAVARSIARLLIQPKHDAADLAALESQAKQLRLRIRQEEQRAADKELMLRLPGMPFLTN
jgi:hypothetical protein